MLKNRTGQSTFEYIILLAAVIVFLFVFLNPTGLFRRATEDALNKSVDQIGTILANVPLSR